MIDVNDFKQALTSPEFFQEGLIYTIIDGKDSCVSDTYNSFVEYMASLNNLIQSNTVFKIQGFEKYNQAIVKKCYELFEQWNKPVNCHAYWGQTSTTSFDMHTDPCFVYIHSCVGNKQIDFEQKQVIIRQGQGVTIEPNTLHKATNLTECLTLSFGSEEYKTAQGVGI